MKKYVVTLSAEERSLLEGIIRKGKAAASRQLHARILLKADVGPGGEGWSDAQIAQALEVNERTVERLRCRLVEEGLEAALERVKQHKRKPKRIDGEAEAQLIAMACGPAPEGRARWTLKLLAGQMVERTFVPSVCPETVRQALKKTMSSHG